MNPLIALCYYFGLFGLPRRSAHRPTPNGVRRPTPNEARQARAAAKRSRKALQRLAERAR